MGRKKVIGILVLLCSALPLVGLAVILRQSADRPDAFSREQLKEFAAVQSELFKLKDLKKKTHHCLVPYDELPEAQKAKDAIFQAVIKGLLD